MGKRSGSGLSTLTRKRGGKRITLGSFSENEEEEVESGELDGYEVSRFYNF